MKAELQVDPRKVQAGSEAFRAYERRDAMYKVATFLVEHHWGKPGEMANALGVVLLTWNNAFYRYGSFDFCALLLRREGCQRAVPCVHAEIEGHGGRASG